VNDARGRAVPQLDPVAMYLLARPDPIDPEALRKIAEELDPGEVRRRRWRAVGAVGVTAFSYIGFFGYFQIFNRWRGWDPELVGLAMLYLVLPPTAFIITYLRAKRRRRDRILRVMLRHGHCPHCGYDIRGLPVDETDGATVCPECGCAWMVPTPSADDTQAERVT
jgi:hypothetical protein